jgi:hypothetical protein
VNGKVNFENFKKEKSAQKIPEILKIQKSYQKEATELRD